MGQEQASQNRDLNILLGGLGMRTSTRRERNVQRLINDFRRHHHSDYERRVRGALSIEEARRARRYVLEMPERYLDVYAAMDYFEQYYYGKHLPNGQIQYYNIIRTYHDDMPRIFDRIHEHDRVDSKQQWIDSNPALAHLAVDFFVTVNEGDTIVE